VTSRPYIYTNLCTNCLIKSLTLSLASLVFIDKFEEKTLPSFTIISFSTCSHALQTMSLQTMKLQENDQKILWVIGGCVINNLWSDDIVWFDDKIVWVPSWFFEHNGQHYWFHCSLNRFLGKSLNLHKFYQTEHFPKRHLVKYPYYAMCGSHRIWIAYMY